MRAGASARRCCSSLCWYCCCCEPAARSPHCPASVQDVCSTGALCLKLQAAIDRGPGGIWARQHTLKGRYGSRLWRMKPSTARLKSMKSGQPLRWNSSHCRAGEGGGAARRGLSQVRWRASHTAARRHAGAACAGASHTRAAACRRREQPPPRPRGTVLPPATHLGILHAAAGPWRVRSLHVSPARGLRYPRPLLDGMKNTQMTVEGRRRCAGSGTRAATI